MLQYSKKKVSLNFFPVRLLSYKMTRISDAIFKDHRKLQSDYQNIKSANDYDTATRWQNQFVWELARHSVGEEIVVYPKFEKYLGEEGKEMAEKDRHEHQLVKEMLYKFQSMKANQSNFIPALDELMASLQKHIDEEEQHDIPFLEKHLSEEESLHMASSFERTKKFVPTHSHPSAPNKPPFETVAGLFAAPIDKLRDMMEKWP